MPSDLTKGAYAGKKTKLYYNSATYSLPTWVEIPRARNIQKSRPRTVNDVNFHGSDDTVGVTGYKAFSGSFEYVKKRGTDSVFDFLESARENGDIVDLAHLNGPVDEADSVGWRAPVLFEASDETSNGDDAVNETFNFKLADAYDGSDNQITYDDTFTGSA